MKADIDEMTYEPTDHGRGVLPRWWRSTAVIVASGCLISLISYGLRTSFGLFAEPVTGARGWGMEVFALAIAIQNLIWGVGQPFAGAVADRYGSARVLAAGGTLYALGSR
jgi:MFS family permease